MVRKSIDPDALETAGIDEFVDIDVLDLNLDGLQQLDIWVDQYNHHLPVDQGVASSTLLSLLVMEQVVDDLIPEIHKQFEAEEHKKLIELINQLQQAANYFATMEKIEVISSLVLGMFVQRNTAMLRVEQLSIAERLQQQALQEMIIPAIALLEKQELVKNTLLTPLQKYPDALDEQLQEILAQPQMDKYKTVILRTIDLIREQTKFRGGGPGEVQLPSYDDFYPELYTQDKEWMPKTVLLSKHTKVWLHQLSRKYDREISKLDQIPDEELEIIVKQGFTGLWLIGLWERSSASRIVKERMGNRDATASAYSLWDYIIAADLGGHEAYYDLSERAGKLGLRLASDMVPNHTGILSKWIIEHPDWFIQTRDSPFSSYQFMSEDLSDHPHVNIYLEDHYYAHSDAAVVFKRVDTQNNDVRYIYHGNDGTSIPWNDTAQLDFLQDEVRQAVINTILHVAKMFPIIRLDAAMVLTKKHFQRLWYPVPGTGGDIPSRSRYGISHQEFDERFPVEFWREVVDRIEQEAPHTLLVAEAFWMLEGYFVRTLGVHRVYNSAFMHMLRDQQNEEYRGLIKSTLTYDPRILQRYVNFMSNPDEDTAIEQFDNGDKYFGCTVMMVTLPGMPMFGHGQIEGFREKYGMEFQRDYWQEEVDQHLVQLHEQLIFPLLRKRYLFAQVKYFRLYDCYHADGYVLENVFAHSNRVGDEFILVCYNNAIDRTEGWIKTTLPFNATLIGVNGGEHQQSTLVAEIMAETSGKYCLFRSFYGNQYYLRTTVELQEQGLYIELNGYQFKVFCGFYLFDDEQLQALHEEFHGAMIPVERLKGFIPDQ